MSIGLWGHQKTYRISSAQSTFRSEDGARKLLSWVLAADKEGGKNQLGSTRMASVPVLIWHTEPSEQGSCRLLL